MKSPAPRDRVTAATAVAALRRLATKRYRDGLARYAIPADHAFGVPVGSIRKLGKQYGRSHELALALWKTGWYEARMLATFVDDPEQVTAAQMDAWARDFDSWAICDTACFHLFDRTPHAMSRVSKWAPRKEEFVRRAAFALLASAALHNKAESDAVFTKTLPLIERAAPDGRNFVKKGVSWALRGVGHRSPELRAAATQLATRLAASDEPAARWVGKDALREFAKRAVRKAPAAKKA